MEYIREYLEQVPEEFLYQDFLEHALREARLYRGRRMYGKDHLTTEYIGTVEHGKWLVDIYEDREGNYWTEDRVRIGKWIITGYELVSGCKDTKDIYELHTGIRSDWDNVKERYNGVPSNWAELPEAEQEENNESYCSDVA